MPCHPDRVRRNHESDAERLARIADAEAAARLLPWQRPSDNAADELLRRAGVTANVIEGEDHDDLWAV